MLCINCTLLYVGCLTVPSLHPLSITKAAFFLALLVAYNHSQSANSPAIDEAHLQLLAAILLTSVKFWSLLVGSVDPFSLPQQATWSAVTALSFPPPERPLVSEIGSTGGFKGQQMITRGTVDQEAKGNLRGGKGTPSEEARKGDSVQRKDKAD